MSPDTSLKLEYNFCRVGLSDGTTTHSGSKVFYVKNLLEIKKTVFLSGYASF